MSLLSGFNVTLSEVRLLGQAAIAAFAGGAVPAGWNVITPQQLGISPQYWDGNYFTNNGASAIVLQQGSIWIVSFRGTDGPNDIAQYPELAFGTYINHFQPLLNAVALNAPNGTGFYFTGASLGGGATNLMASIAGSQYDGEFASAHFVAFASPNISTASGILNFGFENDPIYKAVNTYNNFSSSLDNLVLATPQYMHGNYDGLHPPDDYAHNAALASSAFDRLETSAFLNQMTPDSVVIFDGFNGTVQDVTPGRENTGVFYLGENVADVIIGRNGDDHIEGFGGDDMLLGGAGNDVLAGGTGDDLLNGGPGADIFRYTTGDGTDTITDFAPRVDKIDLTGVAGVHNLSDLTITQNGANAAIVLGSGIILQNVVAGSLTANDFVFAQSMTEPTGPAFPPATVTELIEALYVGYFGRAGDPSGTLYWIDNLNAGFTINQAAASFSVQVETRELYPFLAHPQSANRSEIDSFISSVYADLFNRAPDPGGLDYWHNFLAANLGDPQTVGTFILTAIYGAQNTALGLDQDTIANKVQVAELTTQAFAAAGIDLDSTRSPAYQFAHTVVADVSSSSESVAAAENAIMEFINVHSAAEVALVGAAQHIESVLF